MKIILLIVGIAVSLAAAGIVTGQANTEGVIDYDVKINMHRTLPPGREEMKNMVPEYRTTRHQLFFNAVESLYKPVEEDDDNEFESEHGGLRMKIQQPQVETYFNQITSKRLTQQDFNGKMYLMEDSVSMTPWKFGTETQTIIGYECKQATYFNEERKQNIVAWYAPKLHPFLGPETYNSLPGAVLQVDINEGERVVTAKLVTMRKLKKNELRMPTQGIRITQAAFRKMVEEQMERMRANGGMIIRN